MSLEARRTRRLKGTARLEGVERWERAARAMKAVRGQTGVRDRNRGVDEDRESLPRRSRLQLNAGDGSCVPRVSGRARAGNVGKRTNKESRGKT